VSVQTSAGKNRPVINTRKILCCLAIFGSAFCFYLSTLIIRWSRDQVVIDPSFFAFSRFLLGFGVICAVLLARRQAPVIQRFHLLLGRTLGNCVAVYCFYRAVNVTSVAEANILNMTYPLFIAVLSWMFLKDQRDARSVVMVIIAFIGIWFILAPSGINMNRNNLWGLASGLSASISIIYLNLARQHHDTNTILFFMFGLGTLFTGVAFYDRIFWPDGEAFFYLSLCSVTGVGGQYLITLGFRHVTALEGGIISSTRILLAALLGPILALEPHLSFSGWIGALLIFGSNVYLATMKAGNQSRK
jgi:drug/metabolite transporter (DMT)-like permease